MVHALRVLEYTLTRQNGSHMRVTTQKDGQHHEVVPKHRPIKIGTLQGILRGVAEHHHVSVAELIRMLKL
jgi:predicted RNA binding protein YcfA (HicA-like mRNA interferase family)